METEFVFEIAAEVDVPRDLGDMQVGRRRVVPILGGTVKGPDIRGTILPGGADWQIIRSDGVMELEARYAFETDDGARVHVRNWGIRSGPPDAIEAIMRGEQVDPALIYCRTHPVFDTGAKRYAWLTQSMFAGEARREPDRAIIRIFRLL